MNGVWDVNPRCKLDGDLHDQTFCRYDRRDRPMRDGYQILSRHHLHPKQDLVDHLRNNIRPIQIFIDKQIEIFKNMDGNNFRLMNLLMEVFWLNI